MDNEYPPQLLAELRDGIVFCFSSSDLRLLCAGLGINYENLAGATLEDKARELILYRQRRGTLPELVEACRDARRNYAWPVIDACTE